MKSFRCHLHCLLIYPLIFVLPLMAIAQDPPQQPPEMEELSEVMQKYPTPNKEALFEILKIKEKYPESKVMDRIDQIINIASRMSISSSNTLDEILEIQKIVVRYEKEFSLLKKYIEMCKQITSHPKVNDFSSEKVSQTILNYAEAGKKLSNDPGFLTAVSELSEDEIEMTVNTFNLISAVANIYAKNADKAIEFLEEYKKNGGKTDGDYYYHLGETNELLGKKQVAYEAYFTAAGQNTKGAKDKARALYKEINGDMEKFERMLDNKLSELPFHPEPFSPTEEWNGKTVLAELFTGSECPPCVAVDLAFDALIETYDPKYLTILEYHLPIPGPDPMMNPATDRRQSYYKVTSTPTTFFEGILKHRGGGSKSGAEKKYNQYLSTINQKIYDKPQAHLILTSRLEENIVKVNWTSDDNLEDVYYNFALVQNKVKFMGRNEIPIHKMVVRDFKTLTKQFAASSEKNAKIAFDISKIEKFAEYHLKDYEKQRNFSFKELQFAIDRSQLKVVFFLQDKNTKDVYNSIVCDVIVKE